MQVNNNYILGSEVSGRRYVFLVGHPHKYWPISRRTSYWITSVAVADFTSKSRSLQTILSNSPEEFAQSFQFPSYCIGMLIAREPKTLGYFPLNTVAAGATPKKCRDQQSNSVSF